MIIIIAILLIIVIVLFTSLLFLEKQVEAITKQLKDSSKNKTSKKIIIGLLSGRIERLAQAINETIDEKRECQSSMIKLESDLRQTVANMSHDLRTPLTSIIGYIQLCKLDSIKCEERNEYLNIAYERSKALEGLLNDFYELSLIDSLDFQIKLEKVNISKLLKEILLEKYAEFNDRALEPEIKIADENLFIAGDTKALGRVFENLLGNSIKYAKSGISIYLKEEEDMILFQVSNAAELTSDEAEKIFDRFYMADKTRSGKGTGLGLSIAKGLVEKMKGNITADVGKGKLNIYCRFQRIKM